MRLHALTRLILRDIFRCDWAKSLRPILGGLAHFCVDVRTEASDAPLDSLFKFHAATVEHIKWAITEPGALIDDLEINVATWGMALQLVAKWSGVDRRRVVPIAASDGPNRYHAVGVFLAEEALDRDPIVLRFTVPQSESTCHLEVRIPSFKSCVRAPILLLDFDVTSGVGSVRSFNFPRPTDDEIGTFGQGRFG